MDKISRLVTDLNLLTQTDDIVIFLDTLEIQGSSRVGPTLVRGTGPSRPAPPARPEAQPGPARPAKFHSHWSSAWPGPRDSQNVFNLRTVFSPCSTRFRGPNAFVSPRAGSLWSAAHCPQSAYKAESAMSPYRPWDDIPVHLWVPRGLRLTGTYECLQLSAFIRRISFWSQPSSRIVFFVLFLNKLRTGKLKIGVMIMVFFGSILCQEDCPAAPVQRASESGMMPYLLRVRCALFSCPH